MHRMAEKNVENTEIKKKPLDSSAAITPEWKACASANEKEMLRHLEQYQLTGPGLQASTANNQTYVLLDLGDIVSVTAYNVTAELKSEGSKRLPGWLKKRPHTDVVVTEKSLSQYLIQYGTSSRGKYKLHIRVNGLELKGSPFDITTYPDPANLSPHTRDLFAVSSVQGVAANDNKELLVTTYYSSEKILVLNRKGTEIRSVGDIGFGPAKRVRKPKGVTVDDEGNIYVACEDKVMKYGAGGDFLATAGKFGSRDGEFVYPEGIGVHNQEVYVCDKGAGRIQVFDAADLTYKRKLRFHQARSRPPQLKLPSDITFDAAGRAYIADSGNNRILVVDLPSGDFVREIGHEEGEGKLYNPTGVCIVAENLYVSDDDNCRNVIYRTTGELVATLQRPAVTGIQNKGPCKFTSDKSGHVYMFDTFGHLTTY